MGEIMLEPSRVAGRWARTHQWARLTIVLPLAFAGCSEASPSSDDAAGKGGQTTGPGGATGSGGANAGGDPTATGGSSAGTGGETGGRSDVTDGAAGDPSSGASGSGGDNGGRGGVSIGDGAVAGGFPLGDGATPDGDPVGGGSDSGGGSRSDAAVPPGGGTLPGDIAANAGTPLVAAHSMIRAMYAAYNGKLFQVRRSDGKTQDIGPASPGGKVDTTTLSSFCSGSTCTVAMLYDQAGNANHLPQADAASQMSLQYYATPGGAQVPMAVTANKQYLRNRTNTSKIPKGAASQTEYFVVNTKFFNEKCCWDYGNMELVAKVSSTNGPGKMSALNIGTKDNGYANPGAGSGPWGMVDYEAGVYSGAYRIGQVNPNNPSLTWPIATVLSKTNGTTSWALKVGDAAKGTLITAWNGALPSGYNPLKQEGGLSLGEGGDGSKLGTGAFFEGVVIADVTSDATDTAIQNSLINIFK